MATDIANRHSRELEQKDRELAAKVAAATLEQVQLKVNTDLEALKQYLPTPEKEAHEAALDIKYLQNRQRKLGGLSEVLSVFS